VSCFAAVFVFLRGQDRNWDLLNYHYYAGYSLLNGRYLIDVAAANLQSFFNPIANLFAYLSLKHIPFPLSAWAVLAIQLTNVPPLFLIARTIGSECGYAKPSLTEAFALLLSVIAPLWWSELGTTFFSSWTSPLILWGLYLLLRKSSDILPAGKDLFASGMLIGLAVGLKLTNAPYAISAFVSLLFLVYRSGWRLVLNKYKFFILGGILGFATTAWWNWHLWNEWASPLFPLYNAIFKSPFFDFTNFRDMRWHFSSLSDFIVFVVQAAFGSGKTSELPFADGRYLIIFMLAPGAILCKTTIKYGRKTTAFIFFVLTGFLFWVFMFAYQRYLIPIEMLLGLLAWILVLRIVERERLRIAVLSCLVVLAALTVKVPDYGHAKVPFGCKNPFSIEINDLLTATPARYMVVGVPISYVLPSFHKESVFYGVGLSKHIDNLIIQKLHEPSALPLRIIAKDQDAHTFPDRLRAIGYDPTLHVLDCNYFKTGEGRYIVCEANLGLQRVYPSNFMVDADYSQANYLQANGILWERGLSDVEPWGRWSDGETVEVGLSNCMQSGALRLAITGHAFGPNVGRPVRIEFGDNELFAVFNEVDNEVSIRIDNNDQCANRLLIHIPEPKSPQEMGLSSDNRKLGIGLVRLKINKE
jgi:hypothetical protein